MAEITLADFIPHQEAVERIRKQLDAGSFPHASVISGGPGTGKKTLAKLIARGLLCREEHPPCGQCPNCRLAAEEAHPNLITVQPGEPIAPGLKKDRTTVPVDDIRELVRICSEHTLDGGRRVCLFMEADKMTPQAQNALLKTLEEPPEGTCFLLVTEHPDRLLTTVVSRCQRIGLHPWDEKTMVRILTERGIAGPRAETAASVAEGSVGTAVRIAEDEEYWKARKSMSDQFLNLTRAGDILAVSNAWKDRGKDAETLFSYLEEQFRRMLMHRMHPETPLISDEIPAQWRNVAEKAELESFCRLMDLVAEARKQRESNVNFQAAAEQLLFGMLGVLNRWQK